MLQLTPPKVAMFSATCTHRWWPEGEERTKWLYENQS